MVKNRTKRSDQGDGLPAAGGSEIDHWVDGLEHDTVRYPHDTGDPELDEYIGDIDDAVTAAAADYLRAEGPTLTWVYLQYTNDIAHRYGDGLEMDAAVQAMDRRVGDIANAVAGRAGEDCSSSSPPTMAAMPWTAANTANNPNANARPGSSRTVSG